MKDRKWIMNTAAQFREAILVQKAVEFNIFNQCRSLQTVSDIANKHGWIPRKTRIFLDALVSLGLLEKTELSEYKLASYAAPFLDSENSNYVGDMVMHEGLQHGLWTDLLQVLRARGPLPSQQDITMVEDEHRLTTLLRAMRQYGVELVDRVAILPEWSSCKYILDLAGGHGLFLAAILKSNPSLKGTIIDQPYARSEAESTIQEYRLSNRLNFEVRDLRDEHFLAGFSADGVLLARCLHNFDPARIRQILSEVRRILDPMGTLVIIERYIEEKNGVLVPETNALFSAYMGINCAGGWVPHKNWMIEELKRLGADVRWKQISELHLAYVARW